jgi:hypothetical protein
MDFPEGPQRSPIVHLSVPVLFDVPVQRFNGITGAPIETLTKVETDEILLSNAIIFIDLPSKIVNIDLLKVLLDRCKGIRADLGRASSFDRAFPNLSKLPNYYLALKLDDLEVRLNEKSESSKGELQVLGVSIPNDMIVYVGTSLLAILLIQFCSVCRYLSRNVAALDLEQASRWHLLLKGFGFSWIGRHAVWFLPIGAILSSIIVVLKPHSYHSWFWCIVALAAISALGTSSAIYVNQVYRKSESSNRSSDGEMSNVEP